MFSINISLSAGNAVRVSKGTPVIKMFRDEDTGLYGLGQLTFESPEIFELEILAVNILGGTTRVRGVATPGGKAGE